MRVLSPKNWKNPAWDIADLEVPQATVAKAVLFIEPKLITEWETGMDGRTGGEKTNPREANEEEDNERPTSARSSDEASGSTWWGMDHCCPGQCKGFFTVKQTLMERESVRVKVWREKVRNLIEIIYLHSSLIHKRYILSF